MSVGVPALATATKAVKRPSVMTEGCIIGARLEVLGFLPAREGVE